MSKDNGSTIDYVEIRSSDGSARILRGEKAQEWMEEYLESLCCRGLLGDRPREHKWEHVHFKGEEKKCLMKIVK